MSGETLEVTVYTRTHDSQGIKIVPEEHIRVAIDGHDFLLREPEARRIAHDILAGCGDIQRDDVKSRHLASICEVNLGKLLNVS